MAIDKQQQYSSRLESAHILALLRGLLDNIALPAEIQDHTKNVEFTARRDLPYFPIPFKETETTAALKAIEGSMASLLAATTSGHGESGHRKITVNLEKTTAFLFQAYLATVGGLGKLDKKVRNLLKGKHPGQVTQLRVGKVLNASLARHRPAPGSIHTLPPNVSQPVRDGNTRGVLPHPRLPRGLDDARLSGTGTFPPGSGIPRADRIGHRVGGKEAHARAARGAECAASASWREGPQA